MAEQPFDLAELEVQVKYVTTGAAAAQAEAAKVEASITKLNRQSVIKTDVKAATAQFQELDSSIGKILKQYEAMNAATAQLSRASVFARGGGLDETFKAQGALNSVRALGGALGDLQNKFKGLITNISLDEAQLQSRINNIAETFSQFIHGTGSSNSGRGKIRILEEANFQVSEMKRVLEGVPQRIALIQSLAKAGLVPEAALQQNLKTAAALVSMMEKLSKEAAQANSDASGVMQAARYDGTVPGNNMVDRERRAAKNAAEAADAEARKAMRERGAARPRVFINDDRVSQILKESLDKAGLGTYETRLANAGVRIDKLKSLMGELGTQVPVDRLKELEERFQSILKGRAPEYIAEQMALASNKVQILANTLRDRSSVSGDANAKAAASQLEGMAKRFRDLEADMRTFSDAIPKRMVEIEQFGRKANAALKAAGVSGGADVGPLKTTTQSNGFLRVSDDSLQSLDRAAIKVQGLAREIRAANLTGAIVDPKKLAELTAQRDQVAGQVVQLSKIATSNASTASSKYDFERMQIYARAASEADKSVRAATNAVAAYERAHATATPTVVRHTAAVRENAAAHTDLGSRVSFAARELAVGAREIASGRFGNLASSASLFATRVFNLSPLTIGVGLAFTALGATIIGVFYKGIKAAEDFDKRIKDMVTTNKASGGVVGITASTSLLGIEKDLTANDAFKNQDQAAKAITSLLALRDIGRTVFLEITKIAGDYASVTGKDAAAATAELGAKFADPVKGSKELHERFGILTDDELRLIELMVQSGDKFGAQQTIFRALEPVLKGLSANAITPLHKASQDLGKAWDDALEAFGKTSGIQSARSAIISFFDTLRDKAKESAEETLHSLTILGQLETAQKNINLVEKASVSLPVSRDQKSTYGANIRAELAKAEDLFNQFVNANNPARQFQESTDSAIAKARKDNLDAAQKLLRAQDPLDDQSRSIVANEQVLKKAFTDGSIALNTYTDAMEKFAHARAALVSPLDAAQDALTTATILGNTSLAGGARERAGAVRGSQLQTGRNPNITDREADATDKKVGQEVERRQLTAAADELKIINLETKLLNDLTAAGGAARRRGALGGDASLTTIRAGGEQQRARNEAQLRFDRGENIDVDKVAKAVFDRSVAQRRADAVFTVNEDAAKLQDAKSVNAGQFSSDRDIITRQSKVETNRFARERFLDPTSLALTGATAQQKKDAEELLKKFEEQNVALKEQALILEVLKDTQALRNKVEDDGVRLAELRKGVAASNADVETRVNAERRKLTTANDPDAEAKIAEFRDKAVKEAELSRQSTQAQRINDLKGEIEISKTDLAHQFDLNGERQKSVALIRTRVQLEREGFTKENGLEEALDREIKLQTELAKTNGLIKQRDRFLEDSQHAIQELGSAVSRSLENAIVSGKELSQVLQALLGDIERILIRVAITKPIERAIDNSGFNLLSFFGLRTAGAATGPAITPTPGGPFGFPAGGGAASVAALGAAYTKGVKYFAQGDIFNSPTTFAMAGGGLGMLGEKGPEAIMPLKRGPNNELGVVAHGSASGGTTVFAPNVTVNMNSPGGSPQQNRDAAEATARAVRGQMESFWDERMRKSLRPGGSLNARAK